MRDYILHGFETAMVKQAFEFWGKKKATAMATEVAENAFKNFFKNWFRSPLKTGLTVGPLAFGAGIPLGYMIRDKQARKHPQQTIQIMSMPVPQEPINNI